MVSSVSLIKLSKKLWAGLPGSDSKGYSAPPATMQFAFGVVAADMSFAQISGVDGYLDESRLITGIHWVNGDQITAFSLPPGRYRLYEFTLVRAADNATLKFAKMGGWQFKADINGVETAAIDDENAVPFEVGTDGQDIAIVGINKTYSVLVDKLAGGRPQAGVMFFGSSSGYGLFPHDWNAPAIVSVGVTDATGSLRLDGFTSGGNAFLHEVIPKADYEAGVRANRMDVLHQDGTPWFSCDFAEGHAVTQAELDHLLREPKLNAAARELIRQNLHVGDYLCAATNYLYERQGMLKATVHNGGTPNVKLYKKLWAGVPGSDDKGYSIPDVTMQFAFGIVGADTSFAQMVGADGYLDESKLIGGVIRLSGEQVVSFSLPPGKYRLYEFELVRAADNVTLKLAKMGGWQFKAEVNGVETAAIDDENAIAFEVGNGNSEITLMGINKSFSVLIEKRADGQLKPGVMIFGTSSGSGLFPHDWNIAAIVRVGITDAQGSLRLDGFTSGCNAFIHEVIPRADYEAGVRATRMDVLHQDGSPWFSCDFAEGHAITQAELDHLLHEPKLNAAARELIRQNLHVGDYLCAATNYLYERQGMLKATIHNGGIPNVRLCKKIWAGVPGADEQGRSAAAETIRFAFGIVPGDVTYSQIIGIDRYVDEARLIGGVRFIDGAQCIDLHLPAGRYKLYEFTMVRDADGTRLKYERKGGWDFTADINGKNTGPVGDNDGIPFEVASNGTLIELVGINKALCAHITLFEGQTPKAGALLLGTSSYLGLIPDTQGWNAGATVRVGLTDGHGQVRLDGFSSGNNVFIHQVIAQADYRAGVRPGNMDVYGINGSLWLTYGFPEVRQVTAEYRAALLREPKFNAAARQLIDTHLQVGDYLCGNSQRYFYERQGVMQLVIHNTRG
ncbi:hypothetical protein [Pseudomonas sp. GCEP-101]|uniref:hypothetical protein n=1 Tax=Pseudomonas sp. GCEP-101 TaxID=2974552 RepID=UPI00223C3693|nr:hypothetical protein [Pseudomonas sp. GCEP-101]